MAITSIQNFYESTLSASINNTDLVIPITTPPTPSEGWLCLDYDIPAKREFIYYTSRSSGSVTVPSTGGRGMDGTTAVQHSQNAKIRMNVNGGMLMTLAGNAATIVNQNNNGGWVGLPVTPTITASNGQKEYTLQYTGTDYTDRLQKGSKLMVPRSVAPPTQAMSFSSASSQYASKASPTGITFTTAYTIESWVYLTAYPAGTSETISRTDASNGWAQRINSSGQFATFFGSGGVYNEVRSCQALPLRQWCHIATVCSSVSGKAFAFYLNGVSIPFFSANSAGSTLTQAGALEVGGTQGATDLFDGYISEARVWSVAQTQTQIQNNMGISLTGSETNLVALFQGNGNFNDKTSNANNLAASGGAIATQAANPYSATEYAIVTNVAFTGGNTAVTVFSGQNVIPNATLGSTSYSGQRAPFGFDARKSSWSVRTVYKADVTFPVSSAASEYNAFGFQLYVPTGSWNLHEQCVVGFIGTTTAGMIGRTYITTEAVPLNNSSSNTGLYLNQMTTRWGGMQGTETDGAVNVSTPIDLSSPSTYVALFRTESAGGSFSIRHFGTAVLGVSVLEAECAYL